MPRAKSATRAKRPIARWNPFVMSCSPPRPASPLGTRRQEPSQNAHAQRSNPDTTIERQTPRRTKSLETEDERAPLLPIERHAGESRLSRVRDSSVADLLIGRAVRGAYVA